MRVSRFVAAGLLAMVLPGCEAVAPTPSAPAASPAPTLAIKVTAPPSTASQPVSGGSSLFFATPTLPMGTIAFGTTAEATLVLVDLGSSPVTDLRATFDDRLAPGAGVALAPLGAPCAAATIAVGQRCPLVIRAAPTASFVDGSLLVTVTGALDGQPVVTYATVTLQASGWTTEPIDEESLPDVSEVGQVRATSTLDGVATEHRVDGIEEGLQERDATGYRNRVAGSTRWGHLKVLPGIFAAVAAVQGRVFVAMESSRCGGAGVGVMRNLDNGARRAWSGTTCLTTAEEQMSTWAPAIAVSGHHVYVVAQRTGTGRIDLWRSADDGSTWAATRLGRADNGDEGNPPRVAAFGDTVLVTWTEGGSTVARRSDDRGRTWQPRETVAPGDAWVVTRDEDQLLLILGGGSVRQWTEGGGWRALALPQLDGRPCAAPVVSPGPGAVLALSCSAEAAAGRWGASWWSWSADGGATWAPLEPLPGLGGTAVTAWTADGRPQVQLWGMEDEGGPAVATRVAPVTLP